LKESAQRLIAEIAALTGSRTLHFGAVFLRSVTEPARFSGFSRFLAFLTTHPSVRHEFLGPGFPGLGKNEAGRVKIMVRPGEKTLLRVKHLVKRNRLK
jgi:hypothetical protein